MTPTDYTAYLINLKNLKRYNEAVGEIVKIRSKVECDEMLYTVMFTIYAHTSDAEKAWNLWQEMTMVKNMNEFPFAYNEIIMALGKRRDYAQEAVYIYKQMLH